MLYFNPVDALVMLLFGLTLGAMLLVTAAKWSVPHKKVVHIALAICFPFMVTLSSQTLIFRDYTLAVNFVTMAGFVLGTAALPSAYRKAVTLLPRRRIVYVAQPLEPLRIEQ